jgi:hypothetical protein
MSFLRPPEKRFGDKYFFGLFRFNSVPKFKVKYIPFIPFKIGYAQRGPPDESYIV